MEKVTLGSGTRAIIGTLNDANVLTARTQERLATGLKVNRAIDDALAFFKARSLNSRAADLSATKDAMDGSLGVIRAALHGLEAIESVLKQMKSLAQAAIAAPESGVRAALASQYNELRGQIDNLAEDSGFNGQNLLKHSSARFKGGADELVVKFNERVESRAVNEFVVSGLRVADFATIIAKSAVPRGQVGSNTVWGQTGRPQRAPSVRLLRRLTQRLRRYGRQRRSSGQKLRCCPTAQISRIAL